MGNNALHHAFQNEDHQMIELLLKNSYGDMNERNNNGYLPKEKPHLSKLSPEIRKIIIAYDNDVKLNAQPDYAFVTDLERNFVLLNQLDCLKLKYTNFCLTTDPNNQMLVLVWIPEERLDDTALQHKITTQLHGMQAFLPFETESR